MNHLAYGPSIPHSVREQGFSTHLRSISVEYHHKDLSNATSDWHESKMLGSGSYGAVYKGELHDGSDVAIKVIDVEALQRAGFSLEDAGFEEEVMMWSKFRHPNLVTLMGWGKHQTKRYLIYEFLEGGDVLQRLNKSKNGTTPFLWSERLSVCYDVSLGLCHMHNAKPQVFHGDIKTANILMNRHGEAKMADFGLSISSQKHGATSVQVKQHRGTTGYVCPIYSRTGILTEGSEIYSFGIVMLELLCALAPAAADHLGHMIYPMADKIAPTQPDALNRALRQMDVTAQWIPSLRQEFAELGLRCVLPTEADRPKFKEVARTLRGMMETYSAPARDIRSGIGFPVRAAPVRVLLFGNPGKGKSTLCNCLVKKIAFKAGTTMGGGLTTHVSEEPIENEVIVDTPGIADVSLDVRRAAAAEVTNVLYQGGRCKIVFVVTEQQSRIHEEDKTTIKIILDAAPDIAQDYGIVVNQCGKQLMQMSRNPRWRAEFEKFFLDKLPFTTRHIVYCPFDETLDHKENQIVELHPDVRKFFSDLPITVLEPTKSKKINAENFHSVCEQLHFSREQIEKQQERIKALEKEAADYADKKATSRRLGIQLAWVLNEFPKECKRIAIDHRKPVEDMNFRELAPIVAYGNRAFGKGKVCPRDDKFDCSIVDALSGSGSSDTSTFFLSWVWQYDLKMVLSALRRWQIRQGSTAPPDQCFLWWCFFQNNQFRFLEKQDSMQSTEDLAYIFGGQLLQTGKMLSMMNKIEESIYLQRIWCVFEIFVARQKHIPIEIILPEDAWHEFDRICRGGIRRIQEATRMNVATAEATSKNDETAIKNLITKESSFEEVNKKATSALAASILQMIFEADDPQPAPTYAKGDKVEIWSRSRGTWMAAEIHDFFVADGFSGALAVKAGTLSVVYSGLHKYVDPDQIGNLIRKRS